MFHKQASAKDYALPLPNRQARQGDLLTSQKQKHQVGIVWALNNKSNICVNIAYQTKCLV